MKGKQNLVFTKSYFQSDLGPARPFLGAVWVFEEPIFQDLTYSHLYFFEITVLLRTVIIVIFTLITGEAKIIDLLSLFLSHWA